MELSRAARDPLSFSSDVVMGFFGSHYLIRVRGRSCNLVTMGEEQQLD